MSELTPNAIVQNLMELARKRAELSDGLEKLERDAVNSKADYELAKAKAYLASDGTIPEREAATVLATHAERIAAETAKILVSGRKDQVAALETRIDVGRTAAALVRAELSLDGVRR